MISKKILIVPVALALAFGVMAVSGATTVKAYSFNLDESQVKTVVEEYRVAHRQARLAKMVQKGKLTEAQEQAIEAKLATKPTRADFRAWLKTQGIKMGRRLWLMK